ncbi:MAG: hypothetical protein K9H58_08210 [Bacteroidales bacterium]|nr:hypothetical protein [Bacteroidales bacterium]
MKTRNLIPILLAILLISFVFAKSDNFQSTAAGGDWNDPATWVENDVPTAGDDVVITGPGAVFVEGLNTSTHDACNNITVNSGALLRHKTNNARALDIMGTIFNNGTITDTIIAGDLYLYVYGDIVNSGIWNNDKLFLEGTSTQNIWCNTGKYFGCQEFIDNDNTSSIEMFTDVEFRDTHIDLNYATLILPATKGGTFKVLGGWITEANITGNNGVLDLNNSAYLYSDITISDLSLQGIVNVFSTTNVMSGEIIVLGTLQNRINSSATLQINGNLSNEGTIQNSNNNLNLYITGDIVNNGTWQNTNTWLSGIETHSVSQGASGSFSGTNFYAEAGTGIITANSSIDFDGVNVDLNGGIFIADPLKGDGLTFTDGRLRDGTVFGNGNNISMDIDSFLEDVTMHDFVLQGTVPTYNNNVVFEGNTIVEGMLKNYSLSSDVTFNGPLTNNGTMDNLTNNLNLFLKDDFINNGICTNNKIVFDGTSDQYVACLNGNTISTRIITNSEPTSKIIANDNVSFHTSQINLNGGELQMPLEKRFTLTGSSSLEGRLYDGTISGEAFDYEGNSDAYIQNVTFESEVTLYGQVEVLTQVDFNDSFNNKGILQLHTLSCTINSTDRIINNGTIQDGTGNNLSINCQSHIINNGFWENYRTFLNGVDDQLIYLIAGKEITGQVHFEAMIDDPPYQWQHNGINLNSGDFTGETSDELIWTVPVSNNYNGYFVCQGAADSSRHILIRSGIIIDPVVQLQGPYNGTDMDTVLTQQGLIPLQQPYNMVPWNYDGDEEVTAIPADIVDWILVELRETTGGPETATEDKIVMRRALLLRNDGRAVDPYHQSPELKYDIDLNDNIYMVVWHRNHLGVMTAVPISDVDSPAYYDFSESATQAYGGTDALIDLGNGVYGMMGGDADYNQQITQQDRLGFWDPNAGIPCGYVPYDFTLDRQIDNQDKDQTWVKTLGKSTQVPE